MAHVAQLLKLTAAALSLDVFRSQLSVGASSMDFVASLVLK